MNASTGSTLLLVEDKPADADVVKRLLVEHQSDFATRDHEHTVEIRSIEHVRCLAEAIERVTASEIDVVLLDLGLPDSDGLETISAMHEHTSTVPVIVLTGRKDVGVEAIQRGAQDYLIKGRISAEVLVRTITYAIERTQIVRDLHDRNHRLELVTKILRSDLRNDLSMIVGWGDQLLDSVAHDDRAAVEAMLEASQHGLELTDTAAELIDVLSEDHRVDPVPCDLRTILATEIERLRLETNVDLTMDLDVPETESLSVFGTPLLGSVFKHLLTNATTHTDRDRPTVAVTAEVTETQTTVSIADDGVGMSREQQQYLGDSPETIDERTGIGAGLYFIKTVLESIDGDLLVEDNHPQGTIISVTLARVRSD